MVNDKKYEHPQSSNLLEILKDKCLINDVLFEMEKMAAQTVVTTGSLSVSVT